MQPEELVEYGLRLGLLGIGLTDRDGSTAPSASRRPAVTSRARRVVRRRADARVGESGADPGEPAGRPPDTPRLVLIAAEIGYDEVWAQSYLRTLGYRSAKS